MATSVAAARAACTPSTSVRQAVVSRPSTKVTSHSSAFLGSCRGFTRPSEGHLDRSMRRLTITAGKSPDDDATNGRFIPATHRHLYEGVQNLGPDTWNYKTWYPKHEDTLNTKKKWFIVDAKNKVLGRLACAIAIKIRGKDSRFFTPSMDMGAYVIVINADKVVVSGKKNSQKLYRRHSGRPGGMRVETFDQLQNRIPERIVEHAVRGMLPKGRLGRTLFTHLKVYTGDKHPHTAQQPEELVIKDPLITRNAPDAVAA